MKKEYNFSNGVRGKFYNADAEFNLPIYLEPEIAEFVENLANKTVVRDLTEEKQMTDNRGFFRKLWDGITKTNCPKCNKSGGRETGRTDLEYTDRLQTLNQEEKHYDSKGDYTGSTRRPVQVTLRTTTYDQDYCCDYCNHKWRERKRETKQP